MYDYVVKTLTYSTGDLSEGSSRQGAVEAFENPEQAVCQEFSDTFITLARAAAIPARRNTGYGYAENDDLRPSSFEGDILHAWPEYWNEEKELWIPIDPTWGDTTGGIDYFSNFDLNHIVFAINGNSSTTPYPAGSYKSTGNEAAKDVTISFAETFPAATPNLSVALIPKRVFGIPLPGLVTAIITNQTEQAWYNISLEFESRDPSVTLQKNKTIKIPSILPYEQRKYTLTVYQDGLQLPKQVTIQPRISTETNEVYEHKTLEATSGPAFISYVTDQTIIIAMAGSAVVLTLIAGSVLVLRQRR